MNALIYRAQQRGLALWIFLILLTLAGSYAVLQMTHSPFNAGPRETRLAATLARAKAALLARAIADDNRPGSLPCPDLITNNPSLNNEPGDGRADLLLGNHCPSYVGWLPWATLDLPELTDDSGTRLWYVLSPSLRDDDSAQPINSDTTPELEVDGKGDIAALIIAARAPLDGQHRHPSHRPADYLDGENGNADDHRYISGPSGAHFNDRVLVITRQELMAAVEKRIAGEIKGCLMQHAASPANPEHRSPWPAPLSAPNFEGKAGSLFGRIPETQAGSGPQVALKENIARLLASQNELAGTRDPHAQLSALKEQAETLSQSRNLFEAIFTTTSRLKQSADEARLPLQKIATAVSDATANGRISRSEGSTLRMLTENSPPPLEALPEQLRQSGIDVFPWELARRSMALGSATTSNELLLGSQAMRELLDATQTLRPDIAPALASARSNASKASTLGLAAATSGTAPDLKAARMAVSELLSSADTLRQSVEASRINRLASDIAPYLSLLKSQQTRQHPPPSPESLTALQSTLDASLQAINSIQSDMHRIAQARNASAEALAAAKQALQPAMPNSALFETLLQAAIDASSDLTGAMADNETIDNNLSRSSLSAALDAYQSARSDFVAVDTAAVRPLQSAIVPYAEALGTTTASLNFWAGLISANTATIAPLAKALPPDTSATQAARKGAEESLQAYIETPSTEHRSKSANALAETSRQLQGLIEQAQTLEGQLASTSASAQPMIWASSRCDFLRPGQNTWWHSNQWAGTLFYQIATPLNTRTGPLQVDGRGNFGLVVLAAGRALPAQNRTNSNVASFFEGQNQHASRDGDAPTPIQRFSTEPPSATFNDRLAY